MSVALKVDNTVATEVIESEVSNVLDSINKPKFDLESLVNVAEMNARRAYLAELEKAEKIGERVGKQRARKALIAGIPTDMDAFHNWAIGQ